MLRILYNYVPTSPRINKQEPSNHPKQSPMFPSLNNCPLAVHISDETGVDKKGIISFSQQREFLSISEA